MRRLLHYLTLPVTYPTSVTWVAAMGLMAAMSEGWVSLGVGVFGLTSITIVALSIAMVREVHAVVDLVNRELLDRMTELLAALDRANNNKG